jgi:hypothetical protein
MAIFARDTLFTIPGRFFNDKTITDIESVIFIESFLEKTGRKFEGARKIFAIKNIDTSKTTNTLVQQSVKNNFLALVGQLENKYLIQIVDAENMNIVNTFESPMSFFEISSMEVVSGTDLLIIAGGEHKIVIVKAFESKLGYP